MIPGRVEAVAAQATVRSRTGPGNGPSTGRRSGRASRRSGPVNGGLGRRCARDNGRVLEDSPKGGDSAGAGTGPERERRSRMLGLYALGSLLYWAYYVAAVLITTRTSFAKAMGFAVLGVVPDCLLAPAALAYSRRLASL